MQVRLRPREELEAEAKAFAASLFKTAPEARVINIDALLGFNTRREFVWAGRNYRAPPMPFLAGVRLLLAANAIAECRKSYAPREEMRSAQRLAADCIARTVRPAGIVRRTIARSHRVFIWVFLKCSPEELEGLARWLIHIPDSAPSHTPPPAMKAIDFDFMDAVAAFAKAIPAWVDAHGFPKSWAHYVYGMRHLSRSQAREELRAATAARVATWDQKDFKSWRADLLAAAGW